MSVRRVVRSASQRGLTALGASQPSKVMALLRDGGIVGPSGRRRGPHGGLRESPVWILLAIRAFAAGRHDAALARADAVLRRHPNNLPALAVRRAVHNRRGDATAELPALRAMRAIRDTPGLARNEQMLLGRLRETDPRWLPRIAGPARPYRPRSNVSVMHLLKTSLPHSTSGYTIRSRETLLAQRDAGLEPFAVTALGFPREEPGWDAGEAIPGVELVDGIAHHRLDLGPAWPRQPYDVELSTTAWLAARIACHERPALIHAASGFRGYDRALVGLALREHLDVPVVYEVRGFFEGTWTADEERSEEGEVFARRMEAERRVMLSADAVVTISEEMRGEIVRRGVPAERVTLAPNAVDAGRFTPRAPDVDLLARHGLTGKNVVGYVSSLDHPRENVETLIDALGVLARQGRDVAALIVGDGTRRELLEAYARDAGLAGSVVFTGRVPHDEVPAYYALMEVFVVPRLDDLASRYTTPLKPFEAMAMGVPIVVSDVPALREIAEPDERGLVFPVGDAAGLAAVLLQLLDRPELRARLGAAGRDWVLAERTWQANGRRYRQLYQDVLDRHASRKSSFSAANATTADSADSAVGPASVVPAGA
jgi:glycosyltransferase involved in cell wall biosynthesis